MEIKDYRFNDEQKLPLLRESYYAPNKEKKTFAQSAITQTLKSAAHLAKLLPTGTVLAFQLVSTIFTNQGQCDPVSQYMTAALVTLCGMSCILLSFTDCFKDNEGNICYGFATPSGLWVIDGSTDLPPELAAKYRIRFIDFMHAFMSVSVFAAIALLDKNVVSCFYPTQSFETHEVLTTLPIGIGVLCSVLFVVFPTTRNGIGFPLSSG
ncbi:hypothetical protein ACFE04_002437 [Oxalis oulophora]